MNRASATERREAARAVTGLAAEGTRRPLYECYDAVLLDLDGVVYISGAAIPGVTDAIARLRATGVRVAFVTNNASRTPAAVVANLNGIGVSAADDDVVTAAQAAARLVDERVPAGSAVLACGGAGVRHALYERGLRPVSVASARPAAVVQGFTRGVDYGLLAQAALAVAHGALFVASNADVTIPTKDGVLPGNGSLVEVVRAATGRDPLVAGKPEPPLHRESILRIGAQRPLVVGDRLQTDIEGAVRSGADSMAVLSGVTDAAELVAARPEHRPTYLAADLTGVMDAQPPVDGHDGVGTCRSWTARCRDGGIEVRGDGDPYDGLRAVCAAAWSSPTRVDADGARDAIATLRLPEGVSQ